MCLIATKYRGKDSVPERKYAYKLTRKDRYPIYHAYKFDNLGTYLQCLYNNGNIVESDRKSIYPQSEEKIITDTSYVYIITLGIHVFINLVPTEIICPDVKELYGEYSLVLVEVDPEHWVAENETEAVYTRVKVIKEVTIDDISMEDLSNVQKIRKDI